MSTKNSIFFHQDPHIQLYSSVFDDENIYLELQATKDMELVGAVSNFRLALDGNKIVLTICIPTYVWEAIRQFTNFDDSLVGKTDEELALQAREFVQNRLQEHERYKSDNPAMSRLVAISGCLIYGQITDPIEEQIKKGVENLKQEREAQTKIKQKVYGLLDRNHLKVNEKLSDGIRMSAINPKNLKNL